MARDDAKRTLIQLLDRRAWNPVMRAKPSEYPDADQKRLERLKRKTQSQKDRYRSYETAGKLRQEFRDDLRSEPAKRTHRELRELGLPTQADLADEFFALADRLGVHAERGPTRPHPPHPAHPWHKSERLKREAAKRELEKRARAGDEAAIETLRTAPRKWARDLAEEITRQRGGKRKAAKKGGKRKAAKKGA